MGRPEPVLCGVLYVMRDVLSLIRILREAADQFRRSGGIGRRRLRSEDPARKAADSRFVLALLPNQVQLV